MSDNLLVGGFVRAPEESCCCCLPLRLGLRMAAFLAFFGAQIGIIQTFGMFILYDKSGDNEFVDALRDNMAGFAPSLCLFIILIFRLIQFFSAMMTGSWFLNETKVTRDNLTTGFGVYTVMQVLCGVANLIGIIAYFTVKGDVNIGILGTGSILIPFVYEFYCVYVWLKAR